MAGVAAAVEALKGNTAGAKAIIADLKGSLQNKDDKASKEDRAKAQAATEQKAKDSQQLAQSDYTLYEAANLLRGLIIAQKR